MSSTTVLDAPGTPAAAPPALAPGQPVAPAPLEPIVAPTLLPCRIDGRQITHLSHSSVNLFTLCPEKWRQRYLLGIKFPSSPAMFLGTAVDRTLGAMYEARMRGETPERGDVLNLYDEQFPKALEEEKAGVAFTAAEPQTLIHEYGKSAVGQFLDTLAPRLGRPLSSQRKLEFRLSPQCQWTVVAYMDLETHRVERVAIDPATGAVVAVLAIDGWATPEAKDFDAGDFQIVEREVGGVVDYKVKGEFINQEKADRDPQPATYIAGVQIEGGRAEDFTFAVVRKPGKKYKNFAAKATTTSRTPRQIQGVLARYAVTARAITALYEALGPYTPWPLADPTGNFPCKPQFCEHWNSCPGGAGL